MADINGTAFFERMRRKFGRGATEENFLEDYYDAVTDALRHIWLHANNTSTRPTVSNAKSDISFSEDYEHVLDAGTDYYLMLRGYKPRQSGPNQPFDVETARRRFEGTSRDIGALDLYVMELHHDTQTSDGQDTLGRGAID